MTDVATEPAVEEVRVACLCSCGETPKHKRSRFMPGHDAQLKARLYRTIRDEASSEEEREKARATLDEFEWPQPAPKRPRAPKSATAKEGESANGSEVTEADL